MADLEITKRVAINQARWIPGRQINTASVVSVRNTVIVQITSSRWMSVETEMPGHRGPPVGATTRGRQLTIGATRAALMFATPRA